VVPIEKKNTQQQNRRKVVFWGVNAFLFYWCVCELFFKFIFCPVVSCCFKVSFLCFFVTHSSVFRRVMLKLKKKNILNAVLFWACFLFFCLSVFSKWVFCVIVLFLYYFWMLFFVSLLSSFINAVMFTALTDFLKCCVLWDILVVYSTISSSVFCGKHPVFFLTLFWIVIFSFALSKMLGVYLVLLFHCSQYCVSHIRAKVQHNTYS